MEHVDLLIHNAQVITCASPDGPKRGAALADVGPIPQGAVAVHQGILRAVGPTAELRARYTADQEVDARGRVLCPGFVDCHTHVVYAGDRVQEFEMRLRGASYMELLAAGGGILSTMRHTRAASVDALVAQTRSRLDTMLRLGTTTVEVKTGYGLDPASELKMLEAVARLDVEHPCDLVPTFLGAHAIPPEFAQDPDGYVDQVVHEMVPQVASWYGRSHFAAQEVPLFCDVFCEAGVFQVEQARRVLEAGRAHGMRPKLHADEFESLGGVSLAVELGATSVDHLDVTPAPEIHRLARSDTLGVVLPAVNFHLGSHRFADGRGLVDAGVALALATDINPGSAPCPSMPLAMAIACRYQRLLPAEALNAATVNAAYAVGLGHRLGSLEVGKQADLLLLDTEDYRHLAYRFGENLVAGVLKRGHWVV